MEQVIDEVKKSIVFHKTAVKRLSIGMWVITMFALIAHILIVAVMDLEINRLAALITFAVEKGVGELPKDPSKLAFAGRDNNMGYLVLAMFAAVLLAIFGKMRFHLKEISVNEKRLFSLYNIRAANTEGLEPEVRSRLLENSVLAISSNEPTINLSTETMTKISDTVLSKVEGLIQGKGS